MKKLTTVLLLLFICEMTVSQSNERKWAAGIGEGMFRKVYSSGSIIHWYLSTDVYLSRFLTRRIDLMLKQQFKLYILEKKVEKKYRWIDYSNTLINLRFKYYSSENVFQPYFYFGLGYLEFEYSYGSSFNWDAALGTKLALRKNILLYFESGFVSGGFTHGYPQEAFGLDNGKFNVSLGIEFDFGRLKSNRQISEFSRKVDQDPGFPGMLPILSDGFLFL